MECDHDPGGDHDRVNGCVRRRAVAAPTVNRDVHRVDVRQRVARAIPDPTRLEGRIDMQSQGEVGLRKSPEQSVVEHLRRTQASLLRRLTDQHERSGPLLAKGGQYAGHADE